VRERATTFGPDRGLVGILCEPTPAPDDTTPIVLILNSGIVHHVGVSRLHTRLARRLTVLGFSSLRFDFSGVGDSMPSAETLSIGDALIRDLLAAASHVQSRGPRPIVVFGLCSGGRDALELAVRDPNVVGTLAIDLMSDFKTLGHHVVHFGPRLLRWTSWRNTLFSKSSRLRRAGHALSGIESDSPEAWPATGPRSWLTRTGLREMLTTLLTRDVRMLFVFSNGLDENYNHAGQFAAALPRVAADSRVSERFFKNADHTFSDPTEQARLIDTCADWMTSNFGSAYTAATSSSGAVEG